MIPATEIVTKLDALAACLQWASRVNPASESNRWLRRHVTDPEILDYLERLVEADRKVRR